MDPSHNPENFNMHANVVTAPPKPAEPVKNGGFTIGHWYVAMETARGNSGRIAFEAGEAYLCVGSAITGQQYLVREDGLLVEVTAGHTGGRTKFRRLLPHETIGDVVK